MSHPVIVDRRLPISAEEAWQAWTAPERLTQWLCASANVDVRVGGAYELFWEPDRPEHNSTLGCRVLEVDRPRLLRFEWRGPDQFADVMNEQPFPTRVTVRIEPDGAGARMTLEHEGWGDGDDWEAARAWHERVWAGAVDGLAQAEPEASAPGAT